MVFFSFACAPACLFRRWRSLRWSLSVMFFAAGRRVVAAIARHFPPPRARGCVWQLPCCLLGRFCFLHCPRLGSAAGSRLCLSLRGETAVGPRPDSVFPCRFFVSAVRRAVGFVVRGAARWWLSVARRFRFVCPLLAIRLWAAPFGLCWAGGCPAGFGAAARLVFRLVVAHFCAGACDSLRFVSVLRGGAPVFSRRFF